MNTVSQSLWRFSESYQLFLPLVSHHLTYKSSLISMFAVCTDAKYLEYMNNFCDNMELHMV